MLHLSEIKHGAASLGGLKYLLDMTHLLVTAGYILLCGDAPSSTTAVSRSLQDGRRLLHRTFKYVCWAHQ